MRSDLVFDAMTNVPNRYLLTMLASKAARKLHRPGVRIEDTVDDVLVRFSRANPIGCELALRERLAVQLHPIMTRPANTLGLKNRSTLDRQNSQYVNRMHLGEHLSP
jgi:hypothetical protein